jgi:hypothetical protein
VGIRLDALTIWKILPFWGAKGLRVMIEIFLKAEGDQMSDEWYVALNDILIKAQDVEKNLYRCINDL